LERGGYEDMIRSVIKDFSGRFENCAVFQNQLFTVSQPNESVTDAEHHMANLRKSGVATTHNQMLTIDANWRTLTTEFVQYCIARDVQGKLVKFNFTNFWQPAQAPICQQTKKVVAAPVAVGSPGRKKPVKSTSRLTNTIRDNHMVLWEAFVDFLNAAKATRMPIVLGDKVTLSPEATLTAMHPNKAKTFGHLMGRLRTVKPPGGVGRELGMFCALMKPCCDDMDAVVKLRDLLEMKPARYPQGSSWEPLR
jgi:hypothetical protein